MSAESADGTAAAQDHLLASHLVMGHRRVRSTLNHNPVVVVLFIGALSSSVASWFYFAFFPLAIQVDEVEGIS